MKNETIFSKNATAILKFAILGLGIGALATSIYFANKQKRSDPEVKGEMAVKMFNKSAERESEKVFIPLKVQEKPIKRQEAVLIPRKQKLQPDENQEILVEEIISVEQSEMEEIRVEITTEELVQEGIKGTYTVVTPETETAVFEGGADELKYFMQHYFEYPEEATRFREEGRVVLEFTVSHTGEIKDIKTIESDSPALQKEAERILKLLPNWIPSKVNGIPVDTKVILPIRFELK